MFLFLGQQIRTFSEAVDQYAQLGLRTLCLAWRELEEHEYKEWSLLFKEANTTLVDREVCCIFCINASFLLSLPIVEVDTVLLLYL